MNFAKLIPAALCLTIPFIVMPISHAQMVQQFADDFSTNGVLGSSWQISTWANGSPFACTFSTENVTKAGGLLSLAFSAKSSASQDTCAEVKTTQTFLYGRFVVYMQPTAAPGTVSSFFLYTGRSGTNSHFEIDIEFVAGKKMLHTNYWVRGQPNAQDFYLPDYNIDPDNGIHGYAFEWRAGGITWYVDTTGQGNWKPVRQVNATSQCEHHSENASHDECVDGR